LDGIDNAGDDEAQNPSRLRRKAVVRLGISNVPNDVLQKKSPHLVALEAVLSDLVEYGLAMDAQKSTIL
jgi:hypothetical protein